MQLMTVTHESGDLLRVGAVKAPLEHLFMSDVHGTNGIVIETATHRG